MISLICRGESLGHIKLLPKVNKCVLVNAFQKELQIIDVFNYVKDCELYHVRSLGSECNGMDQYYNKLNFKKVVLPYINECLPIDANNKTRHINIPVTNLSDVNKKDMITSKRYAYTSPTAGMDALLYIVNELNAEEVNIIGMDFYDNSGYHTNSFGNNPADKSKAMKYGESTESMTNFLTNFISNKADVQFNLYTKSQYNTKLENLKIIRVI